MGESSVSGEAPPTRNCVTCGRAIMWNANVCPYCGHDYRTVVGQPAMQKPRSSKPIAGGALILVAGVLAIAMGALFMVVDASDIESWGYSPSSDTDPSIAEITDILGTCGIIGVVMGIVAVMGGVFAIMRKGFALAIIGGIMAILGMGFVIGSILGLVGLILVAISRKEF